MSDYRGPWMSFKVWEGDGAHHVKVMSSEAMPVSKALEQLQELMMKYY